MHQGVSRLIAAFAALALTGGCTRGEAPSRHRHRVATVNSFTEATPVHRVISAPPYAFAATASGLDQWDLRSGRRVRHDADGQLFTTRVSDLAYDAERGALWIVGTDSIARYHLATDTLSLLPSPAPNLSLSHAGAVVAPAPQGGVYLGLSTSVFHGDESGVWTEKDLGAPISALHVGADGDLYVGTRAGLFAIRDETVRLCDLASIRLLLAAPAGGVLIVGSADAGADRVGWTDGERCDVYRPSPELRWLDAAADGERVVVLTAERVYELTALTFAVPVRSLSRDGMTLIPLGEGELPESMFALRPLQASVPPGAQTIAVSGGELLVGTRSLGTAHLSLSGPGDAIADSRWLRREELTEHAALLTVRCDDESECRLANGGGELWSFDGERFARAFARSPVLGLAQVGSRTVAILDRDANSAIRVVAAPATGELAEPVILAQARVPDGYELHRLRVGPGKSVLFGWRRRGESTDTPFALVQSLRIEDGITRTLGAGGASLLDIVACDNHTFAATPEGIYDISAATPILVVDLVAQRLDCDRGRVVAATATAIIRLTGTEATELFPLSELVRDFAVGRDGRVFIADSAGLGIWDGEKVRRYDARRGLLENDLREITLDRFGRIWIRSATGVGLFRL